jgi:hypothetical protein
MRQILLTNRGRSSLQKLDGYLHAKALKLMRQLASETPHDCLKLKLPVDLYRSKSVPVRVIWFYDGEGRIVVDRASQRKNAYRNLHSVHPSTAEASIVRFDDQTDVSESEAIDTVRQLEHTDVEQWPAHEVPQELVLSDGDVSASWWQYLLATFHHTPRLTRSQCEKFDGVVAGLGKQPVLLQAAAGTGKSVCAFHYAIRQNELGAVVYYGAPADLVRDLQGALPKVAREGVGSFHLDEVPVLLASLVPGLPVAPGEVSLEALEQCRKHVGGRLRDITLSPRDVQLYESFICGSGNPKDALFKASTERLQILSKIDAEKWRRAVRELGYRTRTEVARAMVDSPPKRPQSAHRALLIADEAQDLLLDEITALGAIWRQWRKAECETHLWLLGDLNQRISPTNFSWGDASNRLGVVPDRAILTTNYRNTAKILDFANRALAFARRRQAEANARHLPEPADPETCFESGEHVGIVRVVDKAEGEALLSQFRSSTDEAYLRRQLATQVKVLWPQAEDTTGFDRVLILTAKQAKGREFEAAVAFQMFEGDGEPALEESLTWYTLLTRARSRLLLIVTERELNRMGSEFFEGCETMTPGNACAWVEECGSEVSLRDVDDTVRRQLFALRSNGLPFLDTWEVICELDIDPAEFEKEIAPHLATASPALRQRFFAQEAHEPWLRCLAARLLGASDEALRQADRFLRETGNEAEYRRLLGCIAGDLDRSGRIHAGAWVRQSLGETWRLGIPFEITAASAGESWIAAMSRSLGGSLT